jgi:hypothetical protein|tara:strand:+ start:5488 stop:5769 length:282 start_codon:yes stop_codon:yes gene_type:complete
MRIDLMTVEFHLRGCLSLKDKRSRLRGMRDRIGRQRSVAVAETDHQDTLHRSEWAFLVIAQNQQLVDKILMEIEKDLTSQVDASIVAMNREKL